ncbi:MAG TPA: TlpA disulfide reductase family protein [Thermoanaerobaculia bacterium]|nr:TlpA disulfide reductase family protein [Thermoanaerobaculia bacterium]
MKRLVLPLALILALARCQRDETSVAAGSGNAQPKKEAARGPRQQPSEAPSGTDVGSKMPEYAAMYLDGSKFDLAARRDKVVLLNVWATWCGPCRYEIPELQAIHDRYAPRGFEVVGVSVDESGIESVKEFVVEQKMTYPVVLDAEGKLANILQTSVLPTSIIVDRTGKVVWKKYGAIFKGDEELDKAIQEAL